MSQPDYKLTAIHQPQTVNTYAERIALGLGPTGTEASVCHDIADRQQKGIAKYGTTVASNPLHLREWLQHAYEEALDGAIYLRRAMDEMDRVRPPTKGVDSK